MATATAVAAPDVDVVMFSRPGCGFCAKAKALLARRQVRFAVVDVNAEPERIEEAQRRSNAKTFPQILVGSKCLGGAEEEVEEGEEGKKRGRRRGRRRGREGRK